MKPGGVREHFGPEPTPHGGGPASVHAQIHEHAVGKTIAAVYLGDCKTIKSPADGRPFDSEYLLIEFTDGSILPLTVAAGNSFFVTSERETKEIMASAKRRGFEQNS